jgi:hypothetical protein
LIASEAGTGPLRQPSTTAEKAAELIREDRQ